MPLALGRREWGALSRAYYTLQSLGELERLDTVLFDAIHKEHLALFDEDSLTVWAARQGVDANRFSGEYNSPGTSAKVMKAEQMSRDYRVNSVPTIVVGGEYVVMGHVTAAGDDRLTIARQLIDRVAAGKH